MTVVRMCAVALAVGVPVLVGAGPAAAHAELERSEPAEGALVPAVPAAVRLLFTETPSAASGVAVLDGCGQPVPVDVAVDGRQLTISVDGAQPGPWTVDYSVLSDVDAHPSIGRLGFVVAGTPECAQAGPAPAPSPAPSPQPAPDATAGSAGDAAETPPSSQGGLGLAPLAGVAAAVLLAGAGIGLALRRRTGPAR